MDRGRLGRGSSRPRDPRRPIDLDDVIYGIHATQEALAGGEKLRKIHVGDDRKRDPVLRALLALAAAQDVPVRFESRGFFAQFPYKAHQSVVAFGTPFEYVSLEDAICAGPERKKLIVVLDHITDPHNVGAIIRTAECAGAGAVVIPERRSAGVNATVRKASAGAAAHLPIARVGNVAAALRTLKKAGVWIAGAALGAGSIAYTDVDFDRDLAVVIGAEGGGLSQVAANECDFLVTIPLHGKIASLNASVAAAVLLYEADRQRQSRS